LSFGLVLLFVFNNCGRFVDRPYEATFSSQSGESYPWPNNSTTFLTSNQLVSEVTIGDFDQNSTEEAAFFSATPSGDQMLLRLVSSPDFEERITLNTLPRPPDPRTKMLFVDLDSNGGEKELVYLSADRTEIVCLTLSGTLGMQRCVNTRLVVPIAPETEVDFRITRLATGNAIEIGGNLIHYGRNQDIYVESGLGVQDGAWGPWGDWLTYRNGTTCSKVCGNGLEVRHRACNNPAPRNGGAHCPMQSVATACSLPAGADNGGDCLTATMVDEVADPMSVIGSVHAKHCRLRDCSPEECSDQQIYINGSCERDPNATEQYNGVGGTGGLGGPGSGGNRPPGNGGGVVTPEDCGTGEVYDPFSFNCYRAHTYNNISLTHREYFFSRRDEDDNGLRFVDHTYRIGLNHPLHGALTPMQIARSYCQFQGHFDVVSITQRTMTASTEDTSRAFILCDPASNGRYQRCPVRSRHALFRWDYRDVTYNSGATVRYLHSVICRNQNE
jgi:hypothetical protein